MTRIVFLVLYILRILDYYAIAATGNSCSLDAFAALDPSLTGASLKDALNGLIREHNVIPYTSTRTDVWDALQILDASNNDSQRIRLIYSQTEELKSNYGTPEGWNREHLWPKSYGVGDDGADFSDLHHLRPEDWSVNAARSNLYYGECDIASDSECRSPFFEKASPDTSRNGKMMAPPINVRGDIARSMFYMATRYNGMDTNSRALYLSDCPCPTTGTFGLLSELLKWHLEDPVSPEERLRNDIICNQFQNNRNPFVDFPEFVGRIWTMVETPFDCSDMVCPNEDPGNGPSNPPGDEENMYANLEPGDVAVVGFRSGQSPWISLVFLESVESGRIFHITDRPYIGSSFLQNSEGVLTYITPSSGIQAGTVITFTNQEDSSWSIDGSFYLATSGDQFFVYTGSLETPTLVFGFNYQSKNWATDPTNLGTTKSILPEVLRLNSAAIALTHRKTYLYNGPISGSKADLLKNITDLENWSGSFDYDFFSPFEGEFAVANIDSNRNDGSRNAHLLALSICLTQMLLIIILF